MKMGLAIEEYQDLETHLNLSKDLTGTRVRMSETMSSGRCRDNQIGFSMMREGDLQDFLNPRMICVWLFALRKGKVGP